MDPTQPPGKISSGCAKSFCEPCLESLKSTSVPYYMIASEAYCGTNDIGTGVLREKEPRYFEDVEYCEDVAYENTWTAEEYETNVENYYLTYNGITTRAIYGRKLFVTEGGLWGLQIPRYSRETRLSFLPVPKTLLSCELAKEGCLRFMGIAMCVVSVWWSCLTMLINLLWSMLSND